MRNEGYIFIKSPGLNLIAAGLLLNTVSFSTCYYSTYDPGGHSLKIGDGDVRQTRPPLSDRMSPNDPLFISLISLSRNDPHNFENVLSLNDPLFEKYMLSTE